MQRNATQHNAMQPPPPPPPSVSPCPNHDLAHAHEPARAHASLRTRRRSAQAVIHPSSQYIQRVVTAGSQRAATASGSELPRPSMATTCRGRAAARLRAAMLLSSCGSAAIVISAVIAGLSSVHRFPRKVGSKCGGSSAISGR